MKFLAATAMSGEHIIIPTDRIAFVSSVNDRAGCQIVTRDPLTVLDIQEAVELILARIRLLEL